MSTNSVLTPDSPPLTTEETAQAVANVVVPPHKQVIRSFEDPVLENQQYALYTFIPARGATPNEKGLYGFAKIRGTFATEEAAQQRAEKLVREVDSYHSIFIPHVGKPFPVTTKSNFSKVVDQVDLKKESSNAVTDEIKKKRKEEQTTINEIKEREKQLLEDVKKEEHDPEDYYTMMRVKQAQLTWEYIKTKERLTQIGESLAKCRHDVIELDIANPNLHSSYMERYIEARRSSGLPTDPATMKDTFMKYMVDDVPLPEIDEIQARLYN